MLTSDPDTGVMLRFNHIGIPTAGRFDGEIALPHLKERAELMAGAGLRHWHAVRRGVADKDGHTVRCSQRIDIDPNSAANSSLSASSRGVGAHTACHGTHRPERGVPAGRVVEALDVLEDFGRQLATCWP